MLKNLFQQPIMISSETYPDLSNVLLEAYEEQVKQNHIQYDAAQVATLGQLQILLDDLLIVDEYDRKSITQQFFLTRPSCRSIYLFGGVGCGKSMLMDMFFAACPIANKRRVHFHAFMLEVHEFTHQWRKQKNQGDVITALAKQIREAMLLLCFDEFHVSDIADAMILGRLFSQLFALGVVVVATSNRHPNDLYQGGLQRELFLPFIELIKDVAEIIELQAKEDYRLVHLRAIKTTYYYPIDQQAEKFLQDSFNELTVFAAMKPGTLTVFGRQIKLTAIHGDVAFSSFAELCETPLGSADYLEIAREFTTLIIAGIPRLSQAKRNEAKRFTTLIDTLYEHHVKLICTAEVAPDEIYHEGDGAFEFARTVSRLNEMQSANYIHSEHVCE